MTTGWDRRASGPFALIGGAFGLGLKRNVLDLYMFLCRNYQPGDRIFAFGFSRSAFTIRVLTSLVCRQGLIDVRRDTAEEMSGSELKRLASWAYRKDRRRYRDTTLLVRALRHARDLYLRALDALRGLRHYDQVEKRPVDVEFLGLWDTVDAYGLPIAPNSLADPKVCDRRDDAGMGRVGVASLAARPRAVRAGEESLPCRLGR
jgi:uncharacterized protein (DUF2235 family)